MQEIDIFKHLFSLIFILNHLIDWLTFPPTDQLTYWLTYWPNDRLLTYYSDWLWLPLKTKAQPCAQNGQAIVFINLGTMNLLIYKF